MEKLDTTDKVYLTICSVIIIGLLFTARKKKGML